MRRWKLLPESLSHTRADGGVSCASLQALVRRPVDEARRGAIMRRVSIPCAGAFLLLSFVTHRPQSFSACLPEAIKPADVVTSALVGSSNSVKKVTVEGKLIQLKASCKNGKLVDAAGREIRFFRLEGCWGNPPADY